MTCDKTRDPIEWMRRIERDYIPALLHKRLSEILAEAPRIFDPSRPIDERAALLVLIGAQMHPAALHWLAYAERAADPRLKGLAAVVSEEARARFQACLTCLGIPGVPPGVAANPSASSSRS